MTKRPGGTFPKPKVAKGRSPRFNKSTGREYPGSRGTKSPTGNRPVPSVARSTPPRATTPGPTRVSIRRTNMPTPNRRSGTRGY